ncbi:MAG TPA: hypothetical protein VGG28_12995, partial [Kofleriaceae bacterium]
MTIARAAAAVAVMVACHATPATTTPPVAVDPTPEPRHVATPADPALPRELASPAPEPEQANPAQLAVLARWPLRFNEHPEDEPSFDIAGALADPGVTWQDLCKRGAQFRHLAKDQDLVAYLKVWCTDDAGDALYQLGLLAHSNIRGIAEAIRTDTARLIADHVMGNSVEAMLRHAHLIDAPTVDLIAASYLELGKLDEAYAMDRLAQTLDAAPTDATTCHRLARELVLDRDDESHATATQSLEHLAEPRRATPQDLHPPPPDPACVEVATAAGLVTTPVTMKLYEARHAWPSGPSSYAEWQGAFDAALRAFPDPRAIE